MVFRGDGEKISRRSQSVKGDCRKLTVIQMPIMKDKTIT